LSQHRSPETHFGIGHEFLEHLTPRSAWISSRMGQDHFGHNRADTLSRLGRYSGTTEGLYEQSLTIQRVSLFELYKFLYIRQCPRMEEFHKMGTDLFFGWLLLSCAVMFRTA